MKTLSVVSCQCLGWQSVIDAIPCLCWGVIGLAVFYLILKFIVLPWKAHSYEMELKAKAFENEEHWYFQSELKKNFKKELEDKISALEKEKSELDKKLKEEKDDREEKLKKERLQAEHDFYKKITETFYSVKKNNDNKE